MYLVESYMKKEDKIKFLKNLIIVILVIILCFVIFSKFYYQRTLVKLGGIGAMIVLSGSMEPTIKLNEMIIIKEQSEYKKGDIVTYKDSCNNLITHRILEVDGERIITQGDNNTNVDSSIKKADVQGKVIFHSSILGFVYLKLLKPLIILILLGYVLNFFKYIVIAKILLKISRYC